MTYNLFNFTETILHYSYSQGKGGLFSGPGYTESRFEDKIKARDIISVLGNKGLDINSVVGDRNNGPSNWGNVTDWGRTLPKYNIPDRNINGTAPSTVYFYDNNAIYFSINQKNYWAALGVDMAMAKNGETLP